MNNQLRFKVKSYEFLTLYQTPIITLIVIVFSLILYFPALSVEYGIFDDYTMLAFDKENPWDFFLVRIVLQRGRAAGAMIIIWLHLTLKEISDLVFLRWGALISLLIFLGMLQRFLKKECQLNGFWLLIIGISILLLPSAQVSVLKSTLIASIGIPLVFSAMSYYLFHYALRQKVNKAVGGFKWKKMAALVSSLFLFEFSLFIYQTTPFCVWIFTFGLVLFRPMVTWVNTRKIFIQDLLFFGAGAFIYRILNQFVVIPWALTMYKYEHFVESNYTYSMELTKDPIEKLIFLWELFLVSAAGPWHVIFENKGALVFILISFVGLIALAKRFTEFLRHSLPGVSSNVLKTTTRYYIEKVLAIILLLLAVNLPSLLGAGVFHVQGYRAMFSMSVMIILLQVWSMRFFRITFPGVTGKLLLNGFICIWVLSMSFVSFQHVRDAVTHFHTELKTMRLTMSDYDIDRWNRIIVVKTDRDKSFVGRYFEHEFSHGITLRENIIPFFLEKFDWKSYHQRNINLQVVESGWIDHNILQENEYLIDLNQDAYLSETYEKRVVLLSPPGVNE